MRHYSSKRFVNLAVVDLDIAKAYPANFLCILPIQIGFEVERQNHFSRIFGDRSADTARRLLAEALDNEDDPVVIESLEKRLRMLSLNPTIPGKCRNCRNRFNIQTKSRRGSCQECKLGNLEAERSFLALS
jgi:hypothetical protein